jgi:hypothetical protein
MAFSLSEVSWLEPGWKHTLPSGSLSCYTQNMAKSIKVQPKKKRGRPATGKDPLLTSRVPQTTIDAVEAWGIKRNMNRSQAIRELLHQALGIKR